MIFKGLNSPTMADHTVIAAVLVVPSWVLYHMIGAAIPHTPARACDTSI